MSNQKILTAVVLVIALAIVGLSLYTPSHNVSIDQVVVTNFDECAKAGYPVMESYPRQCRTPDGTLFVENVSNPTTPPTVSVGCYVGGCSGEICSNQKDTVSTCIYKPQYACYKNAKCELQASGRCGWTQTAALSTCLSANYNTGTIY